MIIQIPLKKNEQIYKAILTIVNFSMKLTEKEINIISDMLRNNITILNKQTRKLLYSHNKNQYVFNNYVQRLKIKGALLEDNGVIKLNPNFLAVTQDKQSITFEFIKSAL